MIKLDIKNFDKLIFDYYKYTPKTFGFNVNSFIDILQDNCKVYKIQLYCDDSFKNYHFYINLNFDDFNKFMLIIYKNKIIELNELRNIISIYEEYRLFGKIHNLKGPAVISYSNNNYICSYYINGKRYSLNDYCKIISKRMDL